MWERRLPAWLLPLVGRGPEGRNIGKDIFIEAGHWPKKSNVDGFQGFKVALEPFRLFLSLFLLLEIKISNGAEIPEY